MNGTDLAERVTIDGIIAAYEALAAQLRESEAKGHAANAALCAALSSPTLGLPKPPDAEREIRYIRAQVWSAIFDRIGVWRLCSVKRAEGLRRQIQADIDSRHAYGSQRSDVEPLPELTAASVRAVLDGFARGADSMIDEAIAEVFDWLRPRERSKAAEYKTNDPWVIGAAVVVPYACELWCGKYGLRTHARDNFMALENVFRHFDGRAVADASAMSEIHAALQTGTAEGATSYYRFRCCKNSNVHLRFTRPDLVARVNARAGGMALRV